MNLVITSFFFNMIWIIGGTSNGTDLAKIVIGQGYKVLLSVTTVYGENLAQQIGAQVITQKLNDVQMAELIVQYKIQTIIDASHPYATEVSKTAIAVAQSLSCSYIRFERKQQAYDGAQYFDDYAAVVRYLQTTQGKIFVTTGSKFVAQYCELGVERIVARVLASSASLLQCEAAGLLPEQIIASKGLWSVAFTVALLREFDIKYLVTKDSGQEGGVAEKLEAARLCGVESLIIARPAMQYPVVCSDYDAVLALLKMGE